MEFEMPFFFIHVLQEFWEFMLTFRYFVVMAKK